MDLLSFILISIAVVLSTHVIIFLSELIFLFPLSKFQRKINTNDNLSLMMLVFSPLILFQTYIYGLSISTLIYFMHAYFEAVWFKIILVFILIYAVYWQQIKVIIEKKINFVNSKGGSKDLTEFFSATKILGTAAFMNLAIIFSIWPDLFGNTFKWLFNIF